MTSVPNNTLPEHDNDMTFLSFNARSLLNKVDELAETLASENHLFVNVTETWCVPGEPESLYHIDGYTIFRRDRTTHQHGGVLTYVNSNMTTNITRLTNLETTNEDLWLLIQPSTSPTPLLTCVIYRSPTSDQEAFLQELETSIRLMRRQYPQCKCIITGDFNAKHNNWYQGDVTNSCGEHLQSLLLSYNLQQIIDFPTHECYGRLQSCLDLVITNDDQIAATLRDPLGKSDHYVLSCRIGFLTKNSSRFTQKQKNEQEKHMVLEQSRH